MKESVLVWPGLLLVGGDAWGEVPGGDRLGLHRACMGLVAIVTTPPVVWSTVTVTGISWTTMPSEWWLAEEVCDSWRCGMEVSAEEGIGDVVVDSGSCGEAEREGRETVGKSWLMKPGRNCSILIHVICNRFKDASFYTQNNITYTYSHWESHWRGNASLTNLVHWVLDDWCNF